jgi:hypothetical protein
MLRNPTGDSLANEAPARGFGHADIRHNAHYTKIAPSRLAAVR